MNIIVGMERSLGSLVALTVACTFAAALFGLGSAVFSWQSVYEGLAGREQLIIFSRLLVYLALALLLVFRGGWRGVLAAVAMAACATLVEWALWPFAYEWAAISDPPGYEERFGERIGRPTYGQLATFDVLGVGISAALAQGLRMMAHVNPAGPRDE
jgi:hypothetical protein